jgi:hypothetical protein
MQAVDAIHIKANRLKNIRQISSLCLVYDGEAASGRSPFDQYHAIRSHWFETEAETGVFRTAARVYFVNLRLTFFTLSGLGYWQTTTSNGPYRFKTRVPMEALGFSLKRPIRRVR